MTVVVTCGPAWEPLDGMRRLTNASTGRLGAQLAKALTDAGHRVLVLRGDGATAPAPSRAAEVTAFGTNDDLARLLLSLREREPVHALLHAAALCDFRVAEVLDSQGVALRESKIPSRSGRIRLELEPATKVLPRLREWFPRARIAGWKYELNGGRDEALGAAWRQLREAGTDACVLNGAAWGPGFAWCELPGLVTPCADGEALAERILGWLE